ncbi:HNH endonuclease [Moorena producens PAL-8-15-08-1]|uniref:HNH endonuclease n=1 Tax=Moorena producens PAL-8-15-08-1 TaxID=1458985 RepID=A0A1D8TSV2_9CYAN|nr:RNA-guided endonuclease IscB [Moorena producens]AOX00665.1 HNH endonuclease [Moorena producens PAL-8-15-08-1]
MQNYVFIIDQNQNPLNPVRPKRARQLLEQGKASVFRRYPFTLILKRAINQPNIHPLTIKIDPGSRYTGFALLDGSNVIWLGELEHRAQKIKSELDKRRAVRRSRRYRKTRYRKARFLNRKRPEGWLAPSLNHRVLTVETWLNRLIRFAPVKGIAIESVKFDMQKMVNPDISSEEYQQGTLHGYEVKEYLLEKWSRKCTYCGKKDIPLQIEHIKPKSRGGTNRISNLCLACQKCNHKKGNKPIEDYLKNQPSLLLKIKAQAQKPLKDAAAVNATRKAIVKMAQTLNCQGQPLCQIEVTTATGGQTKYHRCRLGLPKQHSIDAACVGDLEKLEFRTSQALLIKSTGQITKRMCRMNKFGFPCSQPRRRYNHDWKTGDIGKTVKNGITYVGKIVVQNQRRFEIRIGKQRIGNTFECLVRLHKQDGYQYSFSPNYSLL